MNSFKLQNYLSIFKKLFISDYWSDKLFLIIIDFNDLIKEILKFFHNDYPQAEKQKFNIHQNYNSTVIKESRKKYTLAVSKILLTFLFFISSLFIYYHLISINFVTCY